MRLQQGANANEPEANSHFSQPLYTTAARDTAVSTSLRSLTVLNILFEYASAR